MSGRGAQGGYVATVVLRVVLLLLVFGQLGFLATRYRLRTDLTSDKLYSLTESTQRVLDGLEDRLLVECYFTRDERLPGRAASARRELRSLLDEYVRRSDGKMQLRFLDPQSDTLLRDKAQRLGMTSQRLDSRDATGLTSQEIWQGLRLRYGADRQKVVPLMPLQPSTFQYESMLTPLIKDLTVRHKPKIKVLAFPTTGGQRGVGANRPQGFDQVQERPSTRYDFSYLDLREGKLVPDDVGIVLLIRPRDLSDRDKYALDQFVMRGGKLVVFADTDEVDIGDDDNRLFLTKAISYDAAGSKVSFLEQLAHYGAKVDELMVADFVGNTQEPMIRVVQTPGGAAGQPLYYPYWFFALNTDWANENTVRQLETQFSPDGKVDEEKVALYMRANKPGMLADHTLTNTFGGKRGPTLYWPCPVELVDPLPDGVRGEVLMRTSPVTLAERPQQDLNPLGSNNPRERAAQMDRFARNLLSRAVAQPRRQIGLAVTLEGAFRSYFADRPVPPRRPKAAQAGEVEDPFAEPPEQPKEEAPPPADDTQGPQPQGTEAPVPEDEPAPLLTAAAGAQVVVIGDSDFIRDDLVTGAYRNVGQAMAIGPVSITGPNWFENLLDWLVQDEDLLALRQKQATDRSIKLAEQGVVGRESLEALQQRITRKQSLLQWANVLGPGAVLLLVWLLVSLGRRARRARFLSSVGAR